MSPSEAHRNSQNRSMSMAKEGEGGEVSAESGAMSDRAAYRDVALRAAWGGNETGADFGPAWKYLTVHPELVNDQDEEVGTISVNQTFHANSRLIVGPWNSTLLLCVTRGF